MKNPLIPLLTLMLTTLSAYAAAPKSGTVSSTHAQYDGNALTLSGQVTLNHGLGTMHSEMASLQKQEAGKEFPFSLIHLENNVNVQLTERGELLCHLADLDFTTLQGNLFSNENDFVSYKDHTAQTIPFQILGKTASFLMVKRGEAEKKNLYDISSLTAQNDVTIHYNHDFILKAHQAHFEKASQATRSFVGVITATPQAPNGVCHLVHQGDRIDSPHVQIDLTQEKLTLQSPTGTLVSSLVPHPKESSLTFSSDLLIWEQPSDTLSLHHNIHIVDSILGTIDAEDLLTLKRGKVEDKRLIQTITTQGKTRLESIPAEQSTPQVLYCFGSLTLERQTQTATLLSPLTDGVVLTKDQLHYEEERIASFADQARIDYALVDRKLTPVTLTLYNHIRLYSLKNPETKRCALADRLTYHPQTHTTILTANPDSRVLFWDEKQSLQITAKEVHITLDPTTKEEIIQGVGDVKFSFTSQEQTLLKEIFPFYNLKAPHHENTPSL